MENFFSAKRKEKLINVTSIVILLFIAVMTFLFTGAGQNEKASFIAQTFIMRNAMFLVVIAELIIIILLFFRILRK